MQLVKVYSNKESFRTVNFQLNKPNFILAKQKNVNLNESGKTYNGVGKSLLVRIIHFCLGASTKDYSSFCSKLSGWEFSLDFKVGIKNYTATRRVDEPDKILFENELIGLDKFKNRMEKICFLIPENTAYLSFRSLIPFFIRPKKASYIDCMKPGKTGSEYQSLLYNSFLIGLDINLAEKKYNLKKEQERIKKLEKNFREDSLLKDFFTGNKDIKLALVELDEEIEKNERNLKNFQVADNYQEIQNKADEVEQNLFNINNEIILLSNSIRSIESSLQVKPTMSKNEIETIYEEASISFSDSLKKTLGEVEEFYKKLVENRIRRLSEQKNEFTLQLNKKIEESVSLKKILDELLMYLGNHQALDLFVSMSNKIGNLKAEKENLDRYQVLQAEYKKKARQIEKDMIEISELTDQYLQEIEESTNNIRIFFRTLSKEFYPNSVAGLTIITNDGENQLAFNIDPRIESDGSDGISNVKLFCYDLTLLFFGRNHSIDMIFHDSRLFDGVDERQKAVMFKIIHKYFDNNKKQYNATINQNQLNEIKGLLSEEEYVEIIEKNIILTLTDENDDEKILGVKIDLDEKVDI